MLVMMIGMNNIIQYNEGVNKMYSYDPVRDDNGWSTKFD